MRLCLFSSFFMQRDIPKYVQHYLTELQRHFDSIIFLNNDCKQLSDDSIEWLRTRKILNYPVKNEGYDFGMWAKYVRSNGIDDVTELVLANDSCVQFAPLDEFIGWSRKAENAVGGMTDSLIRSYHLQSYFLIIKNSAIADAADFLRNHEITTDFLETVYRYEIGLSQFLISKGHQLGAFFTVKNTGYERNIMSTPFDLIGNGLPMIKRKLIYGGPLHKEAAMFLYSHSKGLDILQCVESIRVSHQIDDKKMTELFDFKAISIAADNLKFGIIDRLKILKRRYLNPILGVPNTFLPRYTKH